MFARIFRRITKELSLVTPQVKSEGNQEHQASTSRVAMVRPSDKE